MKRPLLLDLFCGAGGAAMGYHRAGFDLVGVDCESQPRYPFEFVCLDALVALRFVTASRGAGFSAIHASPPCQAYTNAQRIQQRQHPLLVSEVRVAMQRAGLPYVIENVVGAPLKKPTALLCGAMFDGLAVYRHRLFEASFPIEQPMHPEHTTRIAKMGRPVKGDEFMHVVGNFSGIEIARAAMGIPWMSQQEIREAIPPAYTEYIGRQLIASGTFREIVSL